MKTRLILKPGQRGTKSLSEKYGDALLCVRFRYDAELRQRLKTIELVVGEDGMDTASAAICCGRPCSPAHRSRGHADAVPGESSGRKVESGEAALVCEVR
jgi:hypothetical protein